jgi:hypothetical protein
MAEGKYTSGLRFEDRLRACHFQFHICTHRIGSWRRRSLFFTPNRRSQQGPPHSIKGRSHQDGGGVKFGPCG